MCQSLRILLSLLFSIGYSATPGNNATNELYRLNSYEASRMNLVKKIDVLGFQEEQIATANDDKEAEKRAYNLIMQEKEKLLACVCQ